MEPVGILEDDLDQTSSSDTAEDEPTLWARQRPRSCLIVVIAVLIANGAYLLHAFDPNPINLQSGLGTVVQPGLLRGLSNIDPNIGFIAQALGHRAAVDWLHGQVPWWNPYEGAGAPLAGGMQSAAFFPLDVLNLLPNGQVFFRVVLESVAGIGAYLLLRRLTISNVPAVVGAIAFALNGTFSWLFHAPSNPVAFMPFLLLGVEWSREGALQKRRKGWTLIAVALALSVYAGFPEVAYIDGLLVVLWCVVRGIGVPRRALPVYGQSLVLGVGVGALLAAPIEVAFVDYLPHAYVGGHAGGFADVYIGSATALPAQVMPYLFGPIFGFSANDPVHLTPFWDNIGGYLGVTLCLLAVIGLFGRRFRVVRIALAAWILLGLARLVGVHWVLDVVNAIPGARSLAFYRYAPPSWELALVILAALGLDDLLRHSVRRSVVIGCGLFMVAWCLWCWHLAQPVFDALAHAPQHGAWEVSSLLWALGMIAAVVIVGVLPEVWAGAPRLTDRGEQGLRLGAFRQGSLAALVVLDVMVMFALPQFSAPRQATIDTRPVAYLDQHLGNARVFTMGPLAPNYGSYFGIATVTANDLPFPKAYKRFIQHHLQTNAIPGVFTGTTVADPSGPTPAQEFVRHRSAYEAIGVKYALVPAGTQLPTGPGTPFRQVFSDASTRILELPSHAPLFESTDESCTVRPRGRTVVDVECPHPSTVVYRELQMPGWQAEADGRALAVHADGPLFQSVAVPAGRSVIRFSFTPPHEDLAVAAFGVAVLILVAAWVPTWRRRRRRA